MEKDSYPNEERKAMNIASGFIEGKEREKKKTDV